MNAATIARTKKPFQYRAVARRKKGDWYLELEIDPARLARDIHNSRGGKFPQFTLSRFDEDTPIEEGRGTLSGQPSFAHVFLPGGRGLSSREAKFGFQVTVTKKKESGKWELEHDFEPARLARVVKGAAVNGQMPHIIITAQDETRIIQSGPYEGMPAGASLILE